jgi:hypothetical protein
MANYYGNARSNYFHVKDEEAFLAAMEKLPDIEIHRSNNDEGAFCILGCNADGAGWTQWMWDEEIEDDVEVDLPGVVSEHLVDGEVAIFMETGSEKLRYLVGWAEAINSEGERESISIDGIYELAGRLTEKHPNEISRAEY